MNSRARMKFRNVVAAVAAVSLSLTLAATSPSSAESGRNVPNLASVLQRAQAAVDVGDERAAQPQRSLTGAIFRTEIGSVVLRSGGDVEGGQLALGGMGHDITLGLPGTADADRPRLLSGGTAVVSGDHADVAVQVAEEGGVRTQTVIRGPSSPTEFVYHLSLPAGSEAEIASDGGVDIVHTFPGESEGVVVSRFDPPWAVDASGAVVRTHYELRGDELVQIVRHGAGANYPVVADPFWIPAILVAIRVATLTLKVGSKTVKVTKAPASRVVNALSAFKALSFKTGSHTFKLDKSAMKHILERHHPHYWNGTNKSTQTFFNPGMSVGDVRNLVHSAMKQWPATLRSRGTNTRIDLQGTVDGVKYRLVIDQGRVVQFYPR